MGPNFLEKNKNINFKINNLYANKFIYYLGAYGNIVIIIIYFLLITVIYFSNGCTFYAAKLWPLFFLLLFNSLLTSKTMFKLYRHALYIGEEIDVYAKNTKDCNYIKKIVSIMYSTKSNVISGVAFGAFVVFELGFLGFIPATYAGIATAILLFICLMLSAQGYYQLVIFIFMIKSLCKIDEVKYDIIEPAKTNILLYTSKVHKFIIRNFILSGSIFSFCYLLFNSDNKKYIFADWYKLFYDFNFQFYIISWLILLFFIVLALPVLLFYPRRLIYNRIHKLKLRSKNIINSYGNPQSLTNIKKTTDDVKYFAVITNIYTTHCLRQSIDNSPDYPIGLQAFANTIIINITTVIANFLAIASTIMGFEGLKQLAKKIFF